MSGQLHRWVARIRGVTRRSDVERDIRQEMEYHLERRSRELVAEGVEPAEASRQARLEFGGVERYRQVAREQRWGAGIERLVSDTRSAVRSLVHAPVFTATAIVTLALGIGANTAIFSVVRAVLLQPLPYGEPERVLRILTTWTDQDDGGVSPAEYLDFRSHLKSFSHVGAYAFGSLTLTERGDARRIATAFVTPETLAAFGIEPTLGRGFTVDDVESTERTVLVSDDFWRGELGSDPTAVGAILQLNGNGARVGGVLPADFKLPPDLLFGSDRDIYSVFNIDVEEVHDRGSHYLGVVARLAVGAEASAAAEEVEALGEWMVRTFPDDTPKGLRLRTEHAGERVVAPARPALALMATAVGFVLLITIANVAGLILSRNEHRRRDRALRVALGAGKGRLLTLALAESLLLAGAGGVAGTFLAGWTTRAIVALQPAALPRLDTVQIDPVVIAFGAGLSFAIALVFGLMPAARSTPNQLARSLQSESRGASGSHLANAVRRSLVVAEVALAVTLLVCAGLVAKSFARLAGVDMGFDSDGITTARVSLPFASYSESADVVLFFRSLIESLASSPVVEQVGAVTNLPLSTGLGDLNFRIEGREVPEGERSPAADWQVVTPGYLEAMHVPLRRGRLITAADRKDAVGVVVISESTALRFWPDEDPVGQRFLLGGGATPGWVQVVGIVADVVHEGLTSPRSRRCTWPTPSLSSGTTVDQPTR